MEWEDQITSAERNCMQDQSVMDILGARQPVEEEAAASNQSDDNTSRGSITEWIQLGIDIEEKQ